MASDLTRLFDASHTIDADDAQDLTTDDIETVRSLVLEQGQPHDRLRGLDILTAARPALASELLTTIVTRSGEQPELRASAASRLGRLGNPVAERVLVTALRDRTPGVRLRAAGALARIGSAETLERLRPLANDRDASVRRMATFAAAVVSHRAGQVSPQPSPPLGGTVDVPATDGVDVRLERAQPDLVGRVAERLGGDRFGLRADERNSHDVACDGTHLLLLLNVDLPTRAADTGLVAGVVAQEAAADGTYSTRWVILVGPLRGSGRYVAGYGTDGRPAFTGELDPGDDDLAFSVLGVRGIGVPALDARGVLRSDSLEFERLAVDRSSVPSGTPAPFTPPPH